MRLTAKDVFSILVMFRWLGCAVPLAIGAILFRVLNPMPELMHYRWRPLPPGFAVLAGTGAALASAMLLVW